jgi:hypothetical protein
MSKESLEYPDYKRLSPTGSEARILESRLRDAPKIFSPIIIKVDVSLGKERNGVGLSSADMLDVAESSLNLPDDAIIDVYGDDRDSFEVSVRESLHEGSYQAGQSFTSAVHDVTLKISAVIDTREDDSEIKRSGIRKLLTSDSLADAVYLTLPQTWLIPDPEFKPRLSVLPLFPGSFWMQFFKTCWGSVQAATIVFGQDGVGNVGLVVQFKEAKAMRQCVLALYDRYLIHPKEGFGMKMPRVRVVRYSTVAVKKQMAGVQTAKAGQGPSFPSRPLNEAEVAMQSATAYANSKDVAVNVAEAFQKILDRVERLDRENQRLLSLLLDEQEQKAAEDEYIPLGSSNRERSPRRAAEIPASGLPPWRTQK